MSTTRILLRIDDEIVSFIDDEIHKLKEINPNLKIDRTTYINQLLENQLIMNREIYSAHCKTIEKEIYHQNLLLDELNNVIMEYINQFETLIKKL